eukprot:scaffold2431_cov116-Isochrysis_galbana.AAC.5
MQRAASSESAGDGGGASAIVSLDGGGGVEDAGLARYSARTALTRARTALHRMVRPGGPR